MSYSLVAFFSLPDFKIYILFKANANLLPSCGMRHDICVIGQVLFFSSLEYQLPNCWLRENFLIQKFKTCEITFPELLAIRGPYYSIQGNGTLKKFRYHKEAYFFAISLFADAI